MKGSHLGLHKFTFSAQPSSALAVGALVLWLSPQVLSARPRLEPAPGTVFVLKPPLSAPSVREVAATPGGGTQWGASEPRVGSADSDSEGASLQPASLRKRPRRDVVRRALHAVSADVAACVAPRASVRVRVTFVGTSGHAVRTKLLGGAPPEAAACIARAVQRAHVAAFRSRRAAVEHTFSP